MLKMRFSKLVTLLLILVSDRAVAQAPAASDCIALANIIAAGQVTNFTDRGFKALRYYASCEAKDSSAGGALNIAYNAFSLGGNYSEAQKSEMCEKSRSELDITDVEFSQAKVVFDSALPTID